MKEYYGTSDCFDRYKELERNENFFSKFFKPNSEKKVYETYFDSWGNYLFDNYKEVNLMMRGELFDRKTVEKELKSIGKKDTWLTQYIYDRDVAMKPAEEKRVKEIQRCLWDVYWKLKIQYDAHYSSYFVDGVYKPKEYINEDDDINKMYRVISKHDEVLKKINEAMDRAKNNSGKHLMLSLMKREVQNKYYADNAILDAILDAKQKVERIRRKKYFFTYYSDDTDQEEEEKRRRAREESEREDREMAEMNYRRALERWKDKDFSIRIFYSYYDEEKYSSRLLTNTTVDVSREEALHVLPHAPHSLLQYIDTRWGRRTNIEIEGFDVMGGDPYEPRPELEDYL